MPSNSAKHRSVGKTPSKRVIIVIYPGVTLLDAAGPAQVFASANLALTREKRQSSYQIVLASPMGGDIETDSGIVMKTVSLKAASANPVDSLQYE